jgi:hypothetical protein
VLLAVLIPLCQHHHGSRRHLAAPAVQRERAQRLSLLLEKKRGVVSWAAHWSISRCLELVHEGHPFQRRLVAVHRHQQLVAFLAEAGKVESEYRSNSLYRPPTQ